MRTVYLKVLRNGGLVAVKANPSLPAQVKRGLTAISDVPDIVPAEQVRLQISKLVIWPWPTQPVPWSSIATLPIGAVVRNLT